jgi:hypothetical protein
LLEPGPFDKENLRRDAHCESKVESRYNKENSTEYNRAALDGVREINRGSIRDPGSPLVDLFPFIRLRTGLPPVLFSFDFLEQHAMPNLFNFT